MKTPTKRIYRYMLKRALPMFALAGAMIGCKDKPEYDPYAEPIDPVKVLRFGKVLGLDSISYDNVMKYARDPRIETIIYFVDSMPYNNNNNTGYGREHISQLRGILQERLDYTPKATGAGTFIFGRGLATLEDSLWFVHNGWKIRHYGS